MSTYEEMKKAYDDVHFANRGKFAPKQVKIQNLGHRNFGEVVKLLNRGREIILYSTEVETEVDFFNPHIDQLIVPEGAYLRKTSGGIFFEGQALREGEVVKLKPSLIPDGDWILQPPYLRPDGYSALIAAEVIKMLNPMMVKEVIQKNYGDDVVVVLQYHSDPQCLTVPEGWELRQNKKFVLGNTKVTAQIWFGYRF